MNRNDFDKACRVVEQVTQQTKLIESKYTRSAHFPKKSASGA